MALTVEEAKRWANDNATALDEDRLAHDDWFIQMLNRAAPEKAKGLWDSGCWLGETLHNAGATDEQISEIQMAHGQRSFGGDEWQAAVAYANEFVATGDTSEKGGLELAEKRHAELFGE